MNWEKLRCPARVTFKYLNYPKSLCEFGKKKWKCIIRPRFKNLNLCPNLSSNKMKSLHKAGHISNWTWWMRYSVFSNFKNLSMNWEKYVFYWEKRILNPSKILQIYTKEFLTLTKALLILLPLYIQMLITQISTQTFHHKYRKYK